MGDSAKGQGAGLDGGGGPPPVSPVLVRCASRGQTGGLAGIVQVPLDLRLSRPDTLPSPPPLADAQFLPERAKSGAATRSLVGGLLLSSAVTALPAVVGGPDTRSGPRVAVAGAIGLTGLLGYVLHRPGRPLPANVRANQALRDAWQRRVAAAPRGESPRPRGGGPGGAGGGAPRNHARGHLWSGTLLVPPAATP